MGGVDVRPGRSTMAIAASESPTAAMMAIVT
jgi:hypothetical protein